MFHLSKTSLHTFTRGVNVRGWGDVGFVVKQRLSLYMVLFSGIWVGEDRGMCLATTWARLRLGVSTTTYTVGVYTYVMFPVLVSPPVSGVVRARKILSCFSRTWQRVVLPKLFPLTNGSYEWSISVRELKSY